MSVPNQLFSNNATSLLAAPISQIATSLTVMTGYGMLFPQPVDPGDYFLVTLENQTGTEREILKVTGRTGDTFTGIQRAQEGTTAQMWTAMIGDDTLVDHRVTAETMRQALLQPADVSTVNASNVTAITTIDTAPVGATVAKIMEPEPTPNVPVSECDHEPDASAQDAPVKLEPAPKKKLGGLEKLAKTPVFSKPKVVEVKQIKISMLDIANEVNRNAMPVSTKSKPIQEARVQSIPVSLTKGTVIYR